MSDDHVLTDTPDSNHEEWQDRLTDAALRAAIGGETPPDLSEQILARTAELNALVSPRSEARRTTPLRMAIAASLVLACGGLAYWGQAQGGKQRMVALLDDSRQPTATTAVDTKESVSSHSERLAEEIADNTSKVVIFGVAATPAARPVAQDGSGPISKIKAERLKRIHSLDSQSAPANAPVPPKTTVPGQETETFSVDMITVFDSSTEGSKEAKDPQLKYHAEESFGFQANGRASVWAKPTGELEVDAKADRRIAQYQQAELSQKRKPDAVLYRRSLYSSHNRPIAGRSAEAHSYGLAFRGAGQRISSNLFVPVAPHIIRGRLPDSRDGQGPQQPGDQYARIHDNPFVETRGEQALSTLSIDVDTASYANVRRFLNAGQLPPADAVRIEELLNYFDYRYAGPPTDNPAPFAAHLEVTGCPWTPAHRLVRIGVKGREVKRDKRPLSNLVFLVDVSGSMNSSDKLPLVIEGLKKLTEQLGENDRVAIVVYASSEGLALPSTAGDKRDEILSALGRLTAGGSTAGGAGITLAYQIAEDHFIKGGTNRVILCTDGDFNVGTTSTGELERLVAEKAKQTGVYLSVCGFGRGNLNDAMMETVSNQGNGNYFYVDGEQEAEKVFVKGLTGTLVTIAKDVKIQVEFNPAQVAGYRLLGYENRLLAAQDFNDDKKDAGEIGAGHTVTALYEIVPAGVKLPAAQVDELKYQQPTAEGGDAPDRGELAGKVSDELLTLKMRYKQPDGDVSTKLAWTTTDNGGEFANASSDTRFAAAVAGFGMLLRGSEHAGTATFAQVEEVALASLYDKAADPNGYRREFVELVRQARLLVGETTKNAQRAAKGSVQPKNE